MLRPLTAVACACLSVLIALPSTALADWPQWRGENRDGHSPDTGLLQEWPEGGPAMTWKSSGVGIGYSSVAVTDEHIFTLGDVGEDQFVFGLDRKGGKILWKTRIGGANKTRFAGSRSTPTVSGNRVYALGTEGDLLALDSATGKIVWQKSVPKDLSGALMTTESNYNWQYSESPLVDDGKVIVTPGTPKAALTALDAATGKVIWNATLPKIGEAGLDGAGYSSVVVSHGAGIKQYVQLLGRGVVGIEAETGKFLWGYNRVANDVANIPTPIISGDYVFASSGYGTGAALVHLKPKDGGIAAEEVYFLEGNVFQNHHGGMVLVDGYIYSGHGHNKGLPMGIEMVTGKIAWGPLRTAGQASAAVAWADGRLYMRYQNGLMLLAEATPKGFEEKGSFTIPDVQAESWPHPVISDGHLFLREGDNLYCYDLRRGKKGKKDKKDKKDKAKAAR